MTPMKRAKKITIIKNQNTQREGTKRLETKILLFCSRTNYPFPIIVALWVMASCGGAVACVCGCCCCCLFDMTRLFSIRFSLLSFFFPIPLCFCFHAGRSRSHPTHYTTCCISDMLIVVLFVSNLCCWTFCILECICQFVLHFYYNILKYYSYVKLSLVTNFNCIISH